jgi:hypothetical protein
MGTKKLAFITKTRKKKLKSSTKNSENLKEILSSPGNPFVVPVQSENHVSPKTFKLANNVYFDSDFDIYIQHLQMLQSEVCKRPFDPVTGIPVPMTEYKRGMMRGIELAMESYRLCHLAEQENNEQDTPGVMEFRGAFVEAEEPQ